MGFCRRCGDIVTGDRCKCGGTAVAPVVPWNQSEANGKGQDRWSKTYVQRARSVSPTRPLTTQSTGSTSTPSQTSPTKRFPRHISHAPSPNSVSLSNRVSAHIALSTSSASRPSSPIKRSRTAAAPESDILPSLDNTTLSKVYGSVLQPKETLTTHSCAICSSPFPPDATIYPDPTTLSTSRFLCRPCYETNGGTKGICPTCLRPVFTLKSEGNFIHAADQYWHKKCFNCSGCRKNIGDSPMVDLLGRPTCAECFENCLRRDPVTPKKYATSNKHSSAMVEKVNNLGGMGSTWNNPQSREGSPAIEELEQRLGITRSREGSPALEDLAQRLAMLGKSPGSSYSEYSPTARRSTGTRRDSTNLERVLDRRASRAQESPVRSERAKRPEFESQDSMTQAQSRSPSPIKYQLTGTPPPTLDAIEEMKQRFIRASSGSLHLASTAHSSAMRSTPPLRLSRSSASMRSSPRFTSPKSDVGHASPLSPMMPPTPDLMSDFSDTMTQSSFSEQDSPPRNDDVGDIFNVPKPYGVEYRSRYTRGDFLDGDGNIIVEETPSQMNTPTRTPNSTRGRPTPTSAKAEWSAPCAPSPLASKSVVSPTREDPGGDLLSPSSPNSTATSCAGCNGSLFSIRGGGKFVTVPGDDLDSPSTTYHVDCFTCTVCDGVFSQSASGQAVFVKANGGACHIECAPPAKIKIHKLPSMGSLTTNSASPRSSCNAVSLKTTSQSSYSSSSRLERPPVTAPPTLGTTMFPRFGSRIACPGCNKAVSPMEHGVVPGPQGTRWHASCLVCGGKKDPSKVFAIWGGREENKKEPGCGKRLDSAAKTGADGGVWCRECLLLLGVGGSPQASPTRAPLVPSFNGSSSKVAPQLTGTTTLARQFTGLGSGGDPGLLRQLTGGGLSPTRSISPTKQLGGGGMRPRPKSVIGMRSSKSVDEGRGMFLVRQLTGAS